MPKQEREAERRDATIRAVWAAVARHGIEGTTIESVAAIAGFSKGVIHYYFESKKALLLAALEAFLQSYDREIEMRLAESATAGRGGELAGKALEALIDATLPPFSAEDTEAAELPPPGAGERLSPRYKARLFLQFFSLAISDRDFAAVVARNYERQGEAIAASVAALEPGAPRASVLERAACLMALVDGFSLHRVLGYLPEGIAPHGDLARGYLASTAPAAPSKG
jgi:TetR/AcrR family transcriptional repressor of bet genes